MKPLHRARNLTIQAIYDRHGKDRINNLLREAGIANDAESLTDRQARYIRDVDYDTLRDRIRESAAPGEYRSSPQSVERRAGAESGRRSSEAGQEGSLQVGEAEGISYSVYDMEDFSGSYRMDLDNDKELASRRRKRRYRTVDHEDINIAYEAFPATTTH